MLSKRLFSALGLYLWGEVGLYLRGEGDISGGKLAPPKEHLK